jgi:hypothetical protein
VELLIWQAYRVLGRIAARGNSPNRNGRGEANGNLKSTNEQANERTSRQQKIGTRHEPGVFTQAEAAAQVRREQSTIKLDDLERSQEGAGEHLAHSLMR